MSMTPVSPPYSLSSESSGDSQRAPGRAGRQPTGQGRSVGHNTKACEVCRTKKTKCNGSPGKSCSTCRNLGMQCVWGPDGRRPHERELAMQGTQQIAGFAPTQAQYGPAGGPVSAYQAYPQAPAGSQGQYPANMMQGGYYAAGPAQRGQIPQLQQYPNQGGYATGNNMGQPGYINQGGYPNFGQGYGGRNDFEFVDTDMPSVGYFDGEDVESNAGGQGGSGYYRR